MIPFNKPAHTGNEVTHITSAIESHSLSGNGPYSRMCEGWFDQYLGTCSTLLTPSCTHALEMCALLLDIKPGDEVIMPSFTFVSTANAFVLRGASIVFVDIRPDTMNINETLIEAAISPNTKAIIVVHYAGVAYEMDYILTLSSKYNIPIIEDAAQSVLSTFNDKPLGSFGQLSAFSFHETKNITSGGEGGLLSINNPLFVDRAEIIRDKGTNRKMFLDGVVDKYSWVHVGSSFLPSELQAAYLYAQLQVAQHIIDDRLVTWNYYYQSLKTLSIDGHIDLPIIPSHSNHNGHIFYIKVSDISVRASLISFFREHGVHAVFHYVPLHSSTAGLRHGNFSGEDIYTTRESERLLRLPLWYGMNDDQRSHVVDTLYAFFA